MHGVIIPLVILMIIICFFATFSNASLRPWFIVVAGLCTASIIISTMKKKPM